MSCLIAHTSGSAATTSSQAHTTRQCRYSPATHEVRQLPSCRRAPSVITAPRALQVPDRNRLASPQIATCGADVALSLDAVITVGADALLFP